MRTLGYILCCFVLASILSGVRCQNETERFPDNEKEYENYYPEQPTTCVYGEWTPCSASCGPHGRRTRTCSYGGNITYTEMDICNTTCLNGGTIHGGYCECPASFTGLCCEQQADPALSLEMVIDDTDVNFECSLSSVTSSASTTLRFRWFANDEQIFEETLPSSESTSTLEQSSWVGKMGTSIHCEVGILIDGSISEEKKSAPYFAGVKVRGTFGEVIELSENGNEHVIELESTIPLLCESCQVTLPIFVTDRYGIYKAYPDVVVKDGCGAVITPRDSLPGGTIRVTVKARRDFFRDGDGTVYLGFLPVHHSSELWNGYHLIHLIQINTIDKDNNFRRCSGMGDPHYHTFDGEYYDVYKPGEYIFYKHEVYPFEVQTRLKPCGSVACNCGVAVRVEDDVIIYDRCKTTSELVTYFWGHRKYQYYRETSRLIAKVLRKGILTPGFRLVRENSGHTVKIHFPNGAYVEIQGSTYLGVYFSPGSDDYGFENAGLCGSSDNNRGNDLLHGPFKAAAKHYSAQGWGTKHDFSETWRTPSGKNLFYGEFDDGETDSPTYRAPAEYCTCTPSLDELTLNTDFSQVTVDEQCKVARDSARSPTPSEDCDSRHCDVTEDYLEDVDEDNENRRRRSTADESDGLYFTYDENFVPSVPSWPTPSGIDEANATAYCQSLLVTSQAGVACSFAVSADLSSFIEACKTDIQVLDSLNYGNEAAELMKAQCQEKATKDPMLWTFSDDGRLEPPATILGVLCPANCHDNGVCTDGECVCDAGFAGTDCAVDLSVEPAVYTAHKSGLCDTKTDDCTYVSVYGDNFAESDQLTCHVNIIEVTDQGFSRTDDVLTTPAVFVSFEEVKCMTRSNRRRRETTTSTEPSGSLVSISNDGVLVSAELLVIVFNPNCYVCNGTEGFCVRMDDVCVSGDDCYDKDHPKCQDQLTYILVGSILGGIAAIAVIVIVIVVVKKKMAMKAKVGSSDAALERF